MLLIAPIDGLPRLDRAGIDGKVIYLGRASLTEQEHAALLAVEPGIDDNSVEDCVVQDTQSSGRFLRMLPVGDDGVFDPQAARSAIQALCATHNVIGIIGSFGEAHGDLVDDLRRWWGTATDTLLSFRVK